MPTKAKRSPGPKKRRARPVASLPGHSRQFPPVSILDVPTYLYDAVAARIQRADWLMGEIERGKLSGTESGPFVVACTGLHIVIDQLEEIIQRNGGAK